MTKNFYTRLPSEKTANLNLYNLNRRNHATLVPKLFLMAHHARTVTDQISYLIRS